MIGIKSIFKYIFYLLLSLLIILLVLLSFKLIKPVEKIKINRALSGEVNTLTIDGQEFRDLNKNGQLDIYEDYRNLPVDRANDLLKKMRVNRVFDRLNSRYGSGTICIAKENYEKFYLTRRKNLSPAYTSSFYELPVVN